MIVILVPVLDRPKNAARLVKSIRAVSVTSPRIMFLCSLNDLAEQAACRATGEETVVVPWDPISGDWAAKLEWGRRLTAEPFMLLGADDLHFHPGWDVNALRVFEQMPHVGVVGTQDKGNPLVMRGQHSTHPIVRRAYVDQWGTIDDAALMLHDGYDHQYADNELCETAMARGAWHFSHDVVVEHLHPAWSKAQHDTTYDRAYRWAVRDHKHFHQRRFMWRPRGGRRVLLHPQRERSGTGSDGSVAPSARYSQIAHRRVQP